MKNWKIPAKMINDLRVFRKEKKFVETISYPGAASEEIRYSLEDEINSLVDTFFTKLEDIPSKSYVLTEFRKLLGRCEEFDTEDREMVCEYLDRLLDIFGIESSDGLLNEWLYGFDPGNV